MKAREKLQPVGAILHDFLSERGYLSVCKEYEILRRWPEIVGNSVAQATVCERVEDGILYVRASSAAWRQELSYLKHRILNRIHQHNKGKVIKDIVFF